MLKVFCPLCITALGTRGVDVCVYGPSVPVTPVLDAALSESLGGDKVSFDEKAFRFAFNGALSPACPRRPYAGLGKEDKWEAVCLHALFECPSGLCMWLCVPL